MGNPTPDTGKVGVTLGDKDALTDDVVGVAVTVVVTKVVGVGVDVTFFVGVGLNFEVGVGVLVAAEAPAIVYEPLLVGINKIS